MQRVRLAFGRGEGLKYIAHLDMMRLWKRIFRRAEVPLAYSEGFNPHPKISVALPLPVGTTSRGELLDMILETPMASADFTERVESQLPPDLYLVSVVEVDLHEASAAAAVRFAEYEVDFGSSMPAAALADRAGRLLSAASLPRERIKEGRAKRYDLRPLIDDLKVVEEVVDDAESGQIRLWMRLRAGSTGSGRPEEVIAELGVGVPFQSIHRIELVLEAKS